MPMAPCAVYQSVGSSLESERGELISAQRMTRHSTEAVAGVTGRPIQCSRTVLAGPTPRHKATMVHPADEPGTQRQNYNRKTGRHSRSDPLPNDHRDLPPSPAQPGR